jgi:hypothetical protein
MHNSTKLKYKFSLLIVPIELGSRIDHYLDTLVTLQGRTCKYQDGFHNADVIVCDYAPTHQEIDVSFRTIVDVDVMSMNNQHDSHRAFRASYWTCSN